MAADLALDHRRGKCGECDAPVLVEPIAGLDQADRSNLNQIVERLATADVATRNRPDERKMRFDEALAGVRGARGGKRSHRCRKLPNPLPEGAVLTIRYQW